jgi:hypothetical protein
LLPAPLRRSHNHPESPPSCIVKPDDTQIAGEGIAIPVPRLVEFSATAQVIEKRINLPGLNQLHFSELWEQFRNRLPNQIAAPESKQSYQGLAAILDQTALAQ